MLYYINTTWSRISVTLRRFNFGRVACYYYTNAAYKTILWSSGGGASLVSATRDCEL